jgi:hypothetical protein
VSAQRAERTSVTADEAPVDAPRADGRNDDDDDDDDDDDEDDHLLDRFTARSLSYGSGANGCATSVSALVRARGTLPLLATPASLLYCRPPVLRRRPCVPPLSVSVASPLLLASTSPSCP